ncbi:MAG TPA: cation:proton antiporter [Actinomycetota bacterium]|nr:cation:proton antiporter [Actinomycetota bacterium]
MTENSVLVHLFVLFAAAKILGELFEHFRQPAVLGELLGGVLVGPHVIGVVGAESGPVLELMAELGVIILLFTVGLETNLTELRQVGRPAVLVGSLGVAAPFALGAALMVGLGYERGDTLFIAAAMVATSVGVTARVFRDLGALRTPPGRVVLGAAVVDDILALLILAVVGGLAAGDLSTVELTLTILEVLVFVVVVGLAGPRVVKRVSEFAHLPIVPGSPLVFALLLTLGLAALSETIGLAAIIGAFLAGLIFEFHKTEVTSQVEPVYEFLVPFFFAVTGSRLDPGVFTDPSILGLAAAVTVLAVITKLAAGFWGSRSLGTGDAMLVGVGMVPRGEVGLIVASIGLGLGIISTDLYGVVVAMTIVTTLMTPPVLGVLVRRRLRDSSRADES